MENSYYLKAISTLTSYPLKKIRNDMTSQQYMDYTDDWTTFNNIWAFNYTVSSINASKISHANIYTFVSNKEYLSFLRGQQAHIIAYPSSVQQFIMPQ